MPSTFGTVPPLSIFSLRPDLWLFKRLDALGALMLTSASLLLVTVLNETNLAFEWSSGTVIALLVLSGALWIAFFVWEWYMPDYMRGLEPIFPKHFFYNRAWMGMLL
jgi:hypothetical protein